MAEGDDDDSFGDFTFASFNPHVNHQFNGLNFPNTTTTTFAAADANDDDDEVDDEWGDFVETPPGSIAFCNTPSQKSIDPFDFFASNPISQSEVVDPTRVEPGSGGIRPPAEKQKESQWGKLKGAIPLSIFGDVEEEEKDDQVERSGGSDPRDINGKDSKFDQKRNDNLSNGFESNGYVGGSFCYDVIAILYNHPANLNIGSNVESNLSEKDSSLELSGLNLESGPVVKKSHNDFLMNLSNNDNSNQEMTIENGVSVRSNFDALNLNFGGWNTDLNGMSSLTSLDLDNMKILNDQRQLSKDENSSGQSYSNSIEFGVEDAENSHFSGWNSNFDAFKSNSYVMESRLNGLSLNVYGVDMHSDSKGGNEELGGGEDDDEWEFKDACGESNVNVGNEKVDYKLNESSGINAFSSGFTDGSNGSVDFFSVSNGAVDLFATNEIVRDFSQIGAGFDIKSSIAAKHEAAHSGYNFDASVRSEQIEGEDMQNPHVAIQNAASDDSIGQFMETDKENAFMKEEKEHGLDDHKGALPLSIFGDEELEIDGSLNIDDRFMLPPASSNGNSHTLNSAVSIDDLISNLYSQAEISSVNSVQKPVLSGLDMLDSFSGSNVELAADHVDDNSWKFKDAIFQSEAENGSSLSGNDDVHQRSSGELKLQSFIDFYSKLQDELYLVAKGHLASLKETQNIAISVEDSVPATLIEEIEEVCEELGQWNAITKEEHLGNTTQRHSNLHDFVEVLQEPKFCVLETEYDLQRRLSLVEKDPRSALELMGHVKTMLKILMLGSWEEQYIYVSIWSKMINSCAQELQHGAQIWSQALQKNIQHQILAEPEGKTFVLALGEIYRVAELLGVTTKLYKPWILSTPVESSNINSLFDQCHSSWSASGLEAALTSISDSTPAEGYSGLALLLESIKHISDLDALTLQNQVFIQQEPLCQLSLMPQRVAPGMMMVVWDEEECFLKLANFWAHLISSDRPKLPPLHFIG